MPPPGVPRGSTAESQGMEWASWGGEFSNRNRMLYKSSPFNRRPATHTHTHTQDDFANEIIPTSPWTLDTDNITSSLAPGAPSSVPSVDQTVPGDVVLEGVPSKTEGDTQHMDSAPEGASHESLVQLDHSPASVNPDFSVNNGLSASGRPQHNVGNYKQGPVKIQRLPIDGE
jgi:hypothetical protein